MDRFLAIILFASLLIPLLITNGELSAAAYVALLGLIVFILRQDVNQRYLSQREELSEEDDSASEEDNSASDEEDFQDFNQNFSYLRIVYEEYQLTILNSSPKMTLSGVSSSNLAPNLNLETSSKLQGRYGAARSLDLVRKNIQKLVNHDIDCLLKNYLHRVPPDILDAETSSDVTVREEQNATLVCRAKGHPTPRVLWRREDGEMLEIRSGPREIQKVESVSGEIFHLNKVSRTHMGAYLCIASNDVPPAVSKRVVLNVNFAPSIKIPNQLLGAPVGTDVLLECHVEASPNTINYWMRNRHEMLLHGSKHIIEENKQSYRMHLKLTVTHFSSDDVGTYMCVSTNSLGKAEGTIRLYEIYVPTKPPTTTTTTTEIPTTVKPAETTTAKPFELKRMFMPFPTTLAPMESLREQSPGGRSSAQEKDARQPTLMAESGSSSGVRWLPWAQALIFGTFLIGLIQR